MTEPLAGHTQQSCGWSGACSSERCEYCRALSNHQFGSPIFRMEPDSHTPNFFMYLKHIPQRTCMQLFSHPKYLHRHASKPFVALGLGRPRQRGPGCLQKCVPKDRVHVLSLGLVVSGFLGTLHAVITTAAPLVGPFTTTLGPTSRPWNKADPRSSRRSFQYDWQAFLVSQSFQKSFIRVGEHLYDLRTIYSLRACLNSGVLHNST